MSDQSSTQSSGWTPPTGGWHLLSVSDVEPPRGHNNIDNHPTQLMFPGNSESVAIEGWNEVMVEVVRWLTVNRRLGLYRPIQAPGRPGKCLFDTQLIHPDGSRFNPHAHEEVNSLYIETHYTAPEVVRNARLIIEHVGMDAAQFMVRWY